jgi:hypothetical protein
MSKIFDRIFKLGCVKESCYFFMMLIGAKGEEAPGSRGKRVPFAEINSQI